MDTWKNDDELFTLMRRELFTAVVGDIMDQHGRQQQFCPPQIKPLRDDMMVAGRAFPVLEADIGATTPSELKDKPFGLMLEALDALQPNDVYICTGASPSYALWGELMSIRAQRLGSAGAVLNGYSRDTHGVLKLGFPTFSCGSYSQDQLPRGKVVDFGSSIQMNGVTINPGDIVFGDIDGVCIIPKEIEKDVITEALEKARTENKVKTAIEEGMSACKAFDQYGVM
jgi:regulator of RNase E activity RraA